jgi:virulence factor Mce-like protein
MEKGRGGWRARIAAAATLIALAAAVLLATSAGGSNGGYTVRAIFDDAGNVISGEDVKIDGVKVGTIGSVTPTPQAKAAVVLKIENPGFQDFRQDASCIIRPEALIGEKYVDCLPTQTRPEGTPLPPPLKRIPSGQEGEGQYLLPVSNTSSPVDVDLLGDITRLPERERFTIILNELGAGLAGRGSDLNEVIRRANPALRELDDVLRILAGENRVLAKLAVDSDKALAPLAAVRERVADFLVQSNTVAQATAAHRGALAQNLKDFPPFLEQLGPAVERLQRFAEQTAPVFANLKSAAPSIDRVFTGLPAFSSSSEAFFKNLGQTSKVSGPALVGTEPLLGRLQALGGAAKPFSGNLGELLSSFRETGGIERLLDFIFLGAGAANGYDALGHFLRTEGVGTACLTYRIEPSAICDRKLGNTASTPGASAASAASIDAPDTSIVMKRTLAVMKGATAAQAEAEFPGAIDVSEAAPSSKQSSSSAAAAPSGAVAAKSSQFPYSEASQTGGMLLNYLLGN